MMAPLVVAAAAFLPMAEEAGLSRRNERTLRAAGAVEPGGDVYRAMQAAYPGSFLLMVIEAVIRQRAVDGAFVGGAIVFGVAKALKYWAIASLGHRWTYRVLVPVPLRMVTGGPYRYMRHPNYVAVIGELVGAALMAGAPIAGTVGTAGFAALLAARVRVEERAMDAARAR